MDIKIKEKYQAFYTPPTPPPMLFVKKNTYSQNLGEFQEDLELDFKLFLY